MVQRLAGAPLSISPLSYNPPPEPPGGGGCLLGLHGPADPALWAWQLGGIETVKQSKVQAVKLLTGDGIDGALVEQLRNEGVIFFLARLFFPVNGGTVTPEEFVHSVGNSARALYAAGVRYFEVHNEPNLKMEGYISQWRTPEEFAGWYNDVVSLLRPDMPDALFGIPGLSPGAVIDNVRPITEAEFMARCLPLLKDCQWLACHRYWSAGTDGAMGAALSANDFAQEYRPLPVFVTEFSNTTKGYDKSYKGNEITTFHKYINGDLIGAVFSFVESSSDPIFEWEAWRGSAIPVIVAEYIDSL